MIFTQLIQTNLRTKELGKNIEYYNRLDSTNTEAWELIEEGNQHGTVIVTDNQTTGRGRMKNTWSMIPGKGVAFSLIIENRFPSNYSGLISLASGIAVVESLNKRGIETKLKWPNDVFANEKKLGGILSETKIIKNEIVKVVVGVGINVNETIAEHPKDIRDYMTTMLEISKHPHQRELIIAEVINSIEHLFHDISIDPKILINKWLDNCLHLDKKISFYENEIIVEGIFSGLDRNGFAKIEMNNEIKTFGSINLV